ncbi:MAG: thiamine phosphate synthase [Methylohalobius sp. ZOD2]
MPSPFPARGLYAITADLQDSDRLLPRVEAALKGGARLLQLRDKHRRLAPAEARLLLRLCRAHRVPLIVNDDIELARQMGADGVHLGREDTNLPWARTRLGPDAIIGASCYADLDRAVAARKAGATYVAFGAFFSSPTKPHATPAPLDLLTTAKARLNCPIVAIGGITPENGSALLQAGADFLAVIHGVFGQSDPEKAARRYADLFETHAELP